MVCIASVLVIGYALRFLDIQHALVFGPRQLKGRFGFGQLRPRTLHLGFKVPWIQFRQQLPLLDEGPLFGRQFL